MNVTALELNQPVPDFELPDLTGKLQRLSGHRGRIVILNFWSCECPHSERTDQAILSKFARRDDVSVLTVASNVNESAGDVEKAAAARRLPHVLLDANCEVANLFGAQTTPHVFVIDADGILRYRGAVDDVTFRQRNPTRFFLDEAVEALLGGRLPAVAETPAYGCTIVREV